MPTVRDGLEEALEHHRAGRLQQAEQIYRQLIAAAPMQADPYHLIGVIATQVGKHEAALDYVKKAIQLNPFAPVYQNTLGVAYDGMGRTDEALTAFEQAVTIKGDYAEAYFNLARLQDRRGMRDKAMVNCRNALRANPNYIDALCLMGQFEANSNRLEEAADLYRQALRLSPDNLNALNGLGSVRLNQQRFPEAAERLQRVAQMAPNRPDVHYHLGLALQQMGKLDEAEQSHRRSLSLNPNSSETHNNIGICLALRGRLEEAIFEFREAIRLRPDHFEAHSNLGNVLLTQAKYHDAVACYRESLKYNSQNPLAYNNLSAALAPLGFLHEAAQCGELAVKLKFDYPDAHNNLGNIYKDLGWFDKSYASSREAIRQRPDYASSHSNLVMTLNYDPRCTQEQIAAEHWVWYEQQAAKLPRPTSYRNSRDPERPIRIGYISPDYRQHPVADFLSPILENHDRQQYPTVLYSNSGASDQRTQYVRSLVEGWRVVLGRTDYEIAAQVQADEIDILVDLTGHTAHNRLVTFGLKPAPVQVTYLGYPTGTGLPTMDYLLTDAIVDRPEDEACYVEKLVRLDGCFSCWRPWESVPEPSPSPAARNGYVTFGSAHAIMKLNPLVLKLWADLLKAVPSSKLLLARTTLRGPTRDQVVNELAKYGIGEDRLDIRAQWMTPAGHWEVYRDIDISLDVFPWCGHTTACESLWMGVPIVTLEGNRHAGRMVASVLTAVGLTDWIARSPDEYLRIALGKASNIGELASLRERLRGQMAASPLCDGRSFTTRLETVYRQMWRTWCATP